MPALGALKPVKPYSEERKEEVKDVEDGFNNTPKTNVLQKIKGDALLPVVS